MNSPVLISAEELAVLRASHAARLSLETRQKSMEGELCLRTVERDLAREQLKIFQRKLFAARSEARSVDQRDLFFNEAEMLGSANTEPAQEETVDGAAGKVPAKRKKAGRKPIDPSLPRDIVRHELPEAERFCAHDGSPLVEAGAEISEQIDIIPQQIRVIQHQRIKYACPCCDQGMRTTPVPARIIPRGLFTEAALAWIATSKFMDGLPLYRTAALLRRFGSDISRSTLGAGMVRSGLAAQPVINLMQDVVLDSGIIYGDETTIQVLKEPDRPAMSAAVVN